MSRCCHKHKCPECGYVWEHDIYDARTQEEHEQAHQCPECGTDQYEKHFESDEDRQAHRDCNCSRAMKWLDALFPK